MHREQDGVVEETQYGKWFQIALFNLLLASLAGVILRLAFVVEISGFEFKNLLHGHSHMAMIGWGYLAVFALLMQYFGGRFRHQQVFRLLYYGNEVAVVGMFLTFPVFGYSGISIFFTTFHLVLSYIFIFLFLKEQTRESKSTLANRFVKSAFFFHILSTLAIWVLPLLIINDLRHSAVYHLAVQFFLHFQFNGWFIFACLGIFLKFLEQQKARVKTQDVSIFFRLLTIATVLTYAIAVTWSEPLPSIFLINSCGVIIQFVALLYFVKIVSQLRVQTSSRISGSLLRLTLLCFTLKILIQTLVVIPHIAVVAYTIRNFVIGFIHLILLGTLSTFIFALALEIGWLKVRTLKVKVGLILFFMAFIFTETLIFFQGILLWAQKGFLANYYLVLTILSLLFPLGIWLLTRANSHQKSNQINP